MKCNSQYGLEHRVQLSLKKLDISLKNQKNGQNSPKNIKKGIFITKVTNTFDFSSQKSKKNQSCFSRTFHMESPNWYIFNRPDVAGAVLQTPPFLIKSVNQSSFENIS